MQEFVKLYVTQKFKAINREPESYKILLKHTIFGRRYKILGSDWIKKSEYYKACEFWYELPYRWLNYEICDAEFLDRLYSFDAFRFDKQPLPHKYQDNIIFLNRDLWRKRHEIIDD